MSQRFGRRPAATMLAVSVVALFLVACSTSAGVATLDRSGDATPSASASPGSSDPEEALLLYSDCMREQGIDMPDPVVRFSDGGPGGGSETFENADPPADGPNFDPNSEEFQAADDECRHHLDGLGGLEGGEAPQLTPEEEEALLAFTECMRENGIDMPDFQTGGGGIRIGPGEGEEPAFDPRSDEFQAAQEACREHLDALPGPGEEEQQ
jgi:hypothetical protein